MYGLLVGNIACNQSDTSCTIKLTIARGNAFVFHFFWSVSARFKKYMITCKTQISWENTFRYEIITAIFGYRWEK